MTIEPEGPSLGEAPLKVVGQRLARIDAGERVTGRAIYPADLVRPGMIVGRIKRSTHAHARIVGIDTARARAMKGVLAVVTAADFPEIKPGTMIPFGETGADAWVSAVISLARDRVLWQGQPVAAVAAVDRHIADAALDLITVDYEPLPAALDIAAAIAPDAPLLNPELKPKGFDGVPLVRNAGSRTLIEHGDAAAALASSAAVASISARGKPVLR